MNTKRTLLAASISSLFSLSLLMSTQANAAAENAGEFYLGAKTGWANYDFACTGSGLDTDCDNDAWAGSILGGYQFNNWLALEAGYNYFGHSNADYSGAGNNKTRVQNGELSVKGDWNLTDKWSLFGKVGTSYNGVDSNFSGTYGSDVSDNNFSAMLGAGVEYQINHNLRFRTEYQWFNNVGEKDTTGSSDLNYLSIGLVYFFGSNAAAAPVAAVAASEVMAEEQPVQQAPVEKPVQDALPAITLSTGAFAHNSTKLTPDAKKSLDPVADTLLADDTISVKVVGYTDSSGSAAYNQKLSEKRAQSGAEYIESKGVAKDRITVEGKGEDSPIADNSTSEGREKNRRVEVFYAR